MQNLKKAYFPHTDFYEETVLYAPQIWGSKPKMRKMWDTGNKRFTQGDMGRESLGW